MKIGISTREDNNIVCIKDYSDIREKGQIAHFIAEIEVIRNDLIDIWQEWNEREE